VCLALLAPGARGLLVPMAVHVAHNALLQAVERLAPAATAGTLAEFRAEAAPVRWRRCRRRWLLLWLARR
jgi:hypothetical protein